jgi:hypothetical protein
MSENHIFIQDINDNYTVSVDVNGLVGHDKLPSILVFENVHVHIVDAQFVLQIQDEHMLLGGLLCILQDIQLVQFYEIGSQLLVTFVCQDVEM